MCYFSKGLFQFEEKFKLGADILNLGSLGRYILHVLTLFFLEGEKPYLWSDLLLVCEQKNDLRYGSLEQCCPVELFVIKEKFWICAARYGITKPLMAAEHLKYKTEQVRNWIFKFIYIS